MKDSNDQPELESTAGARFKKPRSHRRNPSVAELDLALQRTVSYNSRNSMHSAWSGDAGGGFGGDGGVADLERVTSKEGWCQPIPRIQEESWLQSATPASLADREAGIDRSDTSTGDEEKAKQSSDGEEKDEWEVSWEDGDPECPRHMSNSKKWICTWVISIASMCVTCTSSIYTSTYSQIMPLFHIPRLEAVAGLSLFVMGLGIGPMFLAPLSEFYGRRPIYLVSFTCFCLMVLPCALAPNIAVLLVFRLLTGIAGSAFLSVAGGTVGDMFYREKLSAPMMLYSASPFLGPEIGPLLGGFINSRTSWRWTFWVIMIWSGTIVAALFFLVPETYHPVLLREKAIRLRRETGDERYHAPIERLTRSIPRTIAWSCLRPFQLLFWEPMLMLQCVFTAILLGILYLFFQAFPIVFQGVHGMNLEQGGITFMGLFVGMFVAVISDPWWGKLRAVLHTRDRGPQPEHRLPPAVLGSVLVSIGLFWFSWTTYRSIHWIVPIMGSVVFGAGTLLVFSGVFTYAVDAYPQYAASALAANSFVRSAFSAGFPMFGNVMFEGLGTQWAGCLLAFLTVPMAPTMWFFFVKGRSIRKKSRFAKSS